MNINWLTKSEMKNKGKWKEADNGYLNFFCSIKHFYVLIKRVVYCAGHKLRPFDYFNVS